MPEARKVSFWQARAAGSTATFAEAVVPGHTVNHTSAKRRLGIEAGQHVRETLSNQFPHSGPFRQCFSGNFPAITAAHQPPWIERRKSPVCRQRPIRPRQAIFGGFPRLSGRRVPTLSAYATKMDRSLVRALLAPVDCQAAEYSHRDRIRHVPPYPSRRLVDRDRTSRQRVVSDDAIVLGQDVGARDAADLVGSPADATSHRASLRHKRKPTDHTRLRACRVGLTTGEDGAGTIRQRVKETWRRQNQKAIRYLFSI
jgi:hypothetical protein